MKHLKIFALGMLFLAMNSSCNKDDDKGTASKFSEVLPGKQWVVSKLLLNGLDVTSSSLDDCERDDTIEFKALGVLESKDNAIKCQGVPEVEISDWSLSSDEKKLTFNDTENTVKSFSATQFTLEDSEFGFTTTAIYTAK